MNNDDIMVVRSLINRFYDITDMMIQEINDGSICGNSRDRYTEQIVAICESITTIYKVKGGVDDV